MTLLIRFGHPIHRRRKHGIFTALSTVHPILLDLPLRRGNGVHTHRLTAVLRLIDHIVRTSAQRDRTEINEAVVHAMADLFSPSSLTIYRAFPQARRTMVFACAGIGPNGRYIRNAYLPETGYCQPIDADPLLRNGCKHN